MVSTSNFSSATTCPPPDSPLNFSNYLKFSAPLFARQKKFPKDQFFWLIVYISNFTKFLLYPLNAIRPVLPRAGNDEAKRDFWGWRRNKNLSLAAAYAYLFSVCTIRPSNVPLSYECTVFAPRKIESQGACFCMYFQLVVAGLIRIRGH